MPHTEKYWQIFCLLLITNHRIFLLSSRRQRFNPIWMFPCDFLPHSFYWQFEIMIVLSRTTLLLSKFSWSLKNDSYSCKKAWFLCNCTVSNSHNHALNILQVTLVLVNIYFLSIFVNIIVSCQMSCYSNFSTWSVVDELKKNHAFILHSFLVLRGLWVSANLFSDGHDEDSTSPLDMCPTWRTES